MSKGLFITFEGCEGSGKSTISRILVDKLEKDGYTCVWTREPGGVDIAEQIRGILLNPDNKNMYPETEALLYAAARTQHTKEKIIPAINEGKIVICDRYLGSSCAYQGWARNLGIANIEEINDFGIHRFRPDIEFFINTTPEVGLDRAKGRAALDRMEQESLDFHKSVFQGFLVNAEAHHYTEVLDGTQSIEEIAEQSYQKVKDILSKKLKQEN